MLRFDASLKSELRLFFIIATPLSAAYLAEFMMFITTKMVVGKLGYHSLAAVGIAANISFEVLIVSMGLLTIVGVLAAQAHGAGQDAAMGQSVRQGFIVATALGLPAMYCIWNLDVVLMATRQDPIVVELATDYLHGLAPTVLPILWFSVLRSFVAVLAKTISIMVITVAAVPLNYLLTLWFVHGGYGIDAMGLFGAGLATTIVSWLMFLAIAIHIYRKPLFRGFGIFHGRWQIHWSICREIMWLGLPVAGLTLLEAGLFMGATILSGIISAKTLAAHEITIAWVGIPFVIAFGLAEATMIRVAYAMGRDNLAEARRNGLLGMGLVIIILSTMIVVPITMADTIIQIFISPEDPGYAEVSKLATQFLLIAALFMVFDGLQAAAARALRGMKDNFVPLWIASFGYWVLGLGGGALLAFYYELGGVGLWWGLAIGLAVAACLLSWRFHRFTRPA